MEATPKMRETDVSMRILFGCFSAMGTMLALLPAAWGQSAAPPIIPPEWPVTSAPARFDLGLNYSAHPPPVAYASLFLPNPDWGKQVIRVFTDKGVAAGSETLWSAPGEPATLIFDCSSGAVHYTVYCGSDWPALPLVGTRECVLLESRPGNGKSIATLSDMLQTWHQSTTILGRAVVPGIFEGGNRFGPETSTLLHFQGWFDVPQPEHLQLAPISEDASFVLIDGKEVVESPGNHPGSQDSHGQHQGAVDLAAGPHLLEYYNAFVQDERKHGIMVTLAVKGGTLPDWTILQDTYPKLPFFRFPGLGHETNYELQTKSPNPSPEGHTPPFALQWSTVAESMIDPTVADVGGVSLKLTFLPQTTGTATWTFDDGTTATGPEVTHIFARPGLRVVRLSVSDGGKTLGSVSQTIHVHFKWDDPDVLTRINTADHESLLTLDPAILSPTDLSSVLAVFGAYKETEGLLKILPQVCAKMKDIPEADLPYAQQAALFLAHDWSHSPEAIQLLRALIDRCAQAKPSPAIAALVNPARLSLAGLVLKTSDHTEEVSALLTAVDPTQLTLDQPYQLAVLRADLALATGDIAGARKLYEAQTHQPGGIDARSSIWRTAQLGRTRAFIDRKDFDAAEDTLREIWLKYPVEKMAPDWELTRLSLYQEEQLPEVAYLWSKRLLPVITDTGRAELLYRTTHLAFVQGDTETARKTLTELLKKHPYSQEAAEAKAKWPGQE
jgi:hypothetical protein